MQKIKYLEGLRGIAALIVLLNHLQFICFVTHYDFVIGYINQLEIYNVFKVFLINSINLSFDGRLSVWIFWVLSAYVISIIFFKPNENYNKILIEYVTKRYFRLCIPVLCSVILAYLILKFGLMYNHQVGTVLGPASGEDRLYPLYSFEPNICSAIYSAVYETFFNYQYNSSYNRVLWTIQNEFLGSLFIFSIFGIVRHNSRRYIFYLLILIVLIKLNIIWLCAFVMGYILCDYEFSTPESKIIASLKLSELRLFKYKSYTFILGVAAIIFSRDMVTFVSSSLDKQCLLISFFIVYICVRNSIFQKLLSLKVPLWLGKISFSMYLLHLPIICSLTSFLLLSNASFTGKISATAITIAVVLIVSFFFNKYIDKNAVIYANKIGSYFKKYS